MTESCRLQNPLRIEQVLRENWRGNHLDLNLRGLKELMIDPLLGNETKEVCLGGLLLFRDAYHCLSPHLTATPTFFLLWIWMWCLELWQPYCDHEATSQHVKDGREENWVTDMAELLTDCLPLDYFHTRKINLYLFKLCHVFCYLWLKEILNTTMLKITANPWEKKRLKGGE